MKSLYDESLRLNEDGLILKSELDKKLTSVFEDTTIRAYNPIHVCDILIELSNKYKNEYIEWTQRYFENYNPLNDTNNRLTLKYIDDPSVIEYAIFLGYSKNGNSLWKYKEGYKPTVPCGITTINENEKCWYKLKTIEDK